MISARLDQAGRIGLDGFGVEDSDLGLQGESEERQNSRELYQMAGSSYIQCYDELRVRIL